MLMPSDIFSAQSSQIRAQPERWITRAVLMLDRSLRRRMGIYEFTTHSECLFRLEETQADQTVCLQDGTRICCGDPVLKLHLWNEQWPKMSRAGATVAWACHVRRAMRVSLRELAHYMAEHGSRDSFAAVCADMRLACARESQQLTRIITRFGFEPQGDPEGKPGTLHRFGEAILMSLLLLATNPMAWRGSNLRRQYLRIYLSPTTLAQRYGVRTVRQPHGKRLRGPR